MKVRWIPGESVFANSYIFGTILVDAGVMPMAVAPYKDSIDTILLTHCHFDHIARVREIAHMCRAKVGIHSNDARGLVEETHSLSMHFGARSPGIVPDIVLSEGDTIGDLTVIHTPGHTPGSICLFSEKDKVLIAGDTVFADGYFGRYDFPGGAGPSWPARSNGYRCSRLKDYTRATGSRWMRAGAGALPQHWA